MKSIVSVISTEVRSEEDVDKLNGAECVNFDETLPFIREILGTLSMEAEEPNTSLIGNHRIRRRSLHVGILHHRG